MRASLLASLLCLPAPAVAQTPCGVPAGPDLVASDIPAFTNFASSGGLDAVAFGAELANVGNQPADYVNGSPAHPVMAPSLYRLKLVDGTLRCEQVGMGWVFHGFFPLQQQGHCATCQPGSSQELGVGCTTVDSASIVGNASLLGPRWQVNAFTGAFPVPWDSPPQIAPHPRRLQVHVADLEVTTPTSARYFVEERWVAADEALAGHGANSASYRELLVTQPGGEFTFALGAPAVLERPAVHAWAAADPAVQSAAVPVPGDGVLHLYWKVTQLAPDRWHYEYALYNHDCHRAARSIRFPFPSGVAITAPGFHDVDYHSGDGPGGVTLDGTDWALTTPAGTLQFATDDFATNPSANALRWATTYNFRFDADRPPGPATVTIGLFEPGGGPSEVALAAEGPIQGFVPYCFGDGSASPCPCGNASAPGAEAGCLNSFGSAGTLRASGTPSIAADSLVLEGAGMTNAACLYFQGTLRDNGGLGTVIGDGILCASGAILRLGTVQNVGGASSYPGPGQQPVATRGMVAAPGTRTYQVWYRNAAPFCTSATFNYTNGLEVPWIP